MKKIIIINGPNLNLLGKREPTIYGDLSFENYLLELKKEFNTLDIDYAQSNSEERILELLHTANKDYQGVIINAASYSHTSFAIADGIAAISIPVIEVHISNIYARENFRHHTLLTKNCTGSITGFGLKSYNLALNYFI